MTTCRGGITDLTACFNKDLIQQAITDRGAKSKVSMECGDVFLDEFEDKQDQIFKASATHAEPHRGVADELLSKVWRISLDEAKQTLQATPQLNKEDADSGISCRFSTNN